MQYAMLKSGIETKDEVLVICLFHLLGLAMEIFMVAYGSWLYPEFAYSKIMGVPLYSGFMYASVASYFCQAWRRFNLQIYHSPASLVAYFLAAFIYLNFFTHHFVADLRWLLAIAVLAFYSRTYVTFTPHLKTYRMPLIISFLLIGFFIWLGENVATFLGAWKYAYQHSDWQPVHFQKAGSWTLMAIVSYIIVSELKFYKIKKAPTEAEAF